jgi:single-strand DNA-binding protein
MINLSILGGNLVRDPELRYTPGGTAICEFTIANSKKYKKDDEWVEKTNYVNCICWGVRGERLSEYFTKGKPILVEGELEFQQWETKEGQKRNALKINVQDWFFVGGKAESSNAGGASNPSFPEGNRPDDVNEEEIPF